MAKNLAMIAVSLLALSLFVFHLCHGALVDEKFVLAQVERRGYTNVALVNHEWFAMGIRSWDKFKAARFTFSATDDAGEEVTVIVYTGYPERNFVHFPKPQ